MLLDIGRMRAELGPFAEILIVGDIGSRGKPEDYEVATEFVDAVIDLVGCASDRVSCVPGNHDVDRDAQTPAHGAMRHQLRSVKPREISDILLGYLRDPASADLLLKPFDAYNAFALPFGCDISQGTPVWAPKTLELGSKTVYVHGINSAWIADATDSADSDDQRLVVGAFQFASLAQVRDAISITLCHHPGRWTRDATEIQQWTATAQLVLTGHEHEAGIYSSEDGRTVHIASGAVNPSRVEDGWLPAYNVIELDLDSENPNTLRVSVYPRTWQSRAEFGADPSKPSPLRFDVPLADAKPPPAAPDGAPPIPAPRALDSADHAHAYAIMKAPPDRRRRVARELGLLPTDGPQGLEADRLLLRTAAERGELAELAAQSVGDFEDE